LFTPAPNFGDGRVGAVFRRGRRLDEPSAGRGAWTSPDGQDEEQADTQQDAPNARLFDIGRTVAWAPACLGGKRGAPGREEHARR
jgi:hypothetical protein